MEEDKPARESKHRVIEEAIIGVANAVEALEGLCEQVSQGARTKKATAPEDLHSFDDSLAHFLEKAPGRLNELRDRILKAVEELKVALF